MTTSTRWHNGGRVLYPHRPSRVALLLVWAQPNAPLALVQQCTTRALTTGRHPLVVTAVHELDKGATIKHKPCLCARCPIVSARRERPDKDCARPIPPPLDRRKAVEALHVQQRPVPTRVIEGPPHSRGPPPRVATRATHCLLLAQRPKGALRRSADFHRQHILPTTGALLRLPRRRFRSVVCRVG